MKKKIIVIGAGISGLTTAYLLSKKGFDVTVLEKNNLDNALANGLPIHSIGFIIMISGTRTFADFPSRIACSQRIGGMSSCSRLINENDGFLMVR